VLIIADAEAFLLQPDHSETHVRAAYARNRAQRCRIEKFPAEELLVAGRKYWTAGGALSTVRDSQSHLNTAAGQRAASTAAQGEPAAQAGP
jgi:hypothetical protein